MMRVLVSACLLGERVRYHGGDARCTEPVLWRWLEEGRVVSVCPEVAAGLGVPRPPAEIRGGDGLAVIGGRATVRTEQGADVTAGFVRGAEAALDSARASGARLAVLTDRSPSCGSSAIYDGSFSGVRRDGVGVTTALLESNGIKVFTPGRLAEAARYLEMLEASETESSAPR